MRRMMASILLAAPLAMGSARAQDVQDVPDKYHITNSEKAACTLDAMRLCSGSYPNEDGLISCMRQNHASLSTICRIAFDAGVRRRHL